MFCDLCGLLLPILPSIGNLFIYYNVATFYDQHVSIYLLLYLLILSMIIYKIISPVLLTFYLTLFYQMSFIPFIFNPII